MLEQTLMTLLGPLVANRIWWQTMPDGVAVGASAPVLILQNVGGVAAFYVESELPSHHNSRVQVHVWARTQAERNNLKHLVEKTIAESELVAAPFGAPVDDYDPALKLFGAYQQFGIWHPRPVV